MTQEDVETVRPTYVRRGSVESLRVLETGGYVVVLGRWRFRSGEVGRRSPRLVMAFDGLLLESGEPDNTRIRDARPWAGSASAAGGSSTLDGWIRV